MGQKIWRPWPPHRYLSTLGGEGGGGLGGVAYKDRARPPPTPGGTAREQKKTTVTITNNGNASEQTGLDLRQIQNLIDQRQEVVPTDADLTSSRSCSPRLYSPPINSSWG